MNVFAIAATLILPLQAAAADEPSRIEWKTSYADALAHADKENKPIVIDFVAEWCGWCTRMDEEVYADASVVKALNDFVCLKVDVEAQPDVALAYGVRSLPRTVLVNTHQEIVGDMDGYMPLATFLDFLSSVEEDVRRETGGTKIPVIREGQTSDAPPELEISALPENELIVLLADASPDKRQQATDAIAAKPEAAKILVAALGSDLLGARIAALEALRKSGAPDMPYDPWAAKADRAAALAAWTDWALLNKQAGQPDE